MGKDQKDKSWIIPIWTGLLKNGHPQKIGNAVWLFMKFIDKTTREEKQGNGEYIGWVNGGNPVKIKSIAEEIGFNQRTTQRYIKTLEKHGYISIKRASKGIIVRVNKSKKWVGREQAKGLTPEEREILNFLKTIPGYPFDYERDLEFLRTLWTDFPDLLGIGPGIKILEELKKWKVWLIDHRKKLRGQINYRLRFRNWLEIAQKRKKRFQNVRAREDRENTRKSWEESEEYKELYD